MQNKTYIVISNKVDSTIREYQPDVEFHLFHNIEELSNYIDHDPIRAEILFFSEDIVGQSNAAFSIIAGLVQDNDFLQVDRVVYICEPESQSLRSVKYLIDERGLENWSIINGPNSRVFVQEVINGTYREDIMSNKRKAVYRRPRADYVKEQLKKHDSLEEDYVDDENEFVGIPDEEIPETPIIDTPNTLKYIYVSGLPCRERTAFALLAAQYVATEYKTLILESDPEYHLLTEFATKSQLPATVVTVTELYEDVTNALERIRSATTNLVIVECVDRIPFNYNYMRTLLYYNLEKDFDFFISEVTVDDVPDNTPMIVTIPSTITGLLQNTELIDRSRYEYCDFVAINLQDLPETHVDSGIAISKILQDVLSKNDIICPVVTMSSLRLDSSTYDLGIILGRSLHQ